MKTQLLKVLTVAMLFLMPNVNFGQAPDLGYASSFALFTAVGAFNNDGATQVIGDIGTNVGDLTGFPVPGTVIGAIHVEDPVSALAAIDVLAAYGYLSTLGGSVLGTLLGNGQILTPGVYSTGAGAATLHDTLYLNGQNDTNALFIIRIGGAFETNTFSKVILINSASLCNVYWQIGGAFTLGDYSVFRGTIVADGAIELLEGSSLLGRGLSVAGAIELHNDLVINSCAPSSAVPISTWALVLGGALIALFVFIRYRHIV